MAQGRQKFASMTSCESQLLSYIYQFSAERDTMSLVSFCFHRIPKPTDINMLWVHCKISLHAHLRSGEPSLVPPCCPFFPPGRKWSRWPLPSSTPTHHTSPSLLCFPPSAPRTTHRQDSERPKDFFPARWFPLVHQTLPSSARPRVNSSSEPLAMWKRTHGS